MTKHRINRWSGVALALVTAILLMDAGLAPSDSLAYSQRRAGQRAKTNQHSVIYDRSYRQGYNEGFGQGQADWGKHISPDFQRSDQYQNRDRSIKQGQGSSDDFTHGYNLGLELGYSDGYYGRVRNLAVPANSSAMDQPTSAADAEQPRNRQSVSDSWDRWTGPNRQRSYPPLSVPDNTRMRLRLTSPINTKTDKVGDRFTAALTSPSRYIGASVAGHIATVNRSGGVTVKTELALAFDSITLADGEQGPFNADLERILTSEEVKKVDEEGRVESGNPARDSAAEGALTGIIVGGPAGERAIYVEGNNDIILDNGTEMIIRTARRRQ